MEQQVPTILPTNFLAEPRRQSMIALVFYVLKFLRVALRTLWPLLLVYFVNSGGGDKDSFWLPIIVGVAGIQLLSSIISYFRFYYYARDGELCIEKGVLRKTKLNIPFERIQTISFNQNILHQILKVYEVKIDTAGSATTELSIEALDKETAERIRDFVMREKAMILDSVKTENEEYEGGEISPIQTAEGSRLLFKRSERELLKIGISENHVRTFFIILGFIFGLFQFGDDLFDLDYGDMFWSTYDKALELPSVFFPTLVAIMAILTLLVSLVRTVIKYYQLSVYESPTGFKMVAGLFNRQEQSVPFHKIQFVRWSINPIQKLLDFRTIRFYQASSIATTAKKALPIPGSSLSNLNALLAKIFPAEERRAYETGELSPLIIRRRVLFQGVLPAIVILLQAISTSSVFLYILAAVWIPFIWFMAKRYHQRYEIHLNEQVLEIHSGIFGRRYTLLRLFKVQAIELTQSPYQRRKSLASLELHTAAGRIKIPYLALETAQDLRNYILYEVEREERVWM